MSAHTPSRPRRQLTSSSRPFVRRTLCDTPYSRSERGRSAGNRWRRRSYGTDVDTVVRLAVTKQDNSAKLKNSCLTALKVLCSFCDALQQNKLKQDYIAAFEIALQSAPEAQEKRMTEEQVVQLYSQIERMRQAAIPMNSERACVDYLSCYFAATVVCMCSPTFDDLPQKYEVKWWDGDITHVIVAEDKMIPMSAWAEPPVGL
jgi:hypothetical protein